MHVEYCNVETNTAILLHQDLQKEFKVTGISVSGFSEYYHTDLCHKFKNVTPHAIFLHSNLS